MKKASPRREPQRGDLTSPLVRWPPDARALWRWSAAIVPADRLEHARPDTAELVVRLVLRSPTGREIPRDSPLTEDLGLVCRWHATCFDLQTGEARNWAPRLQADGTSPGWEFMGDISKNRAPIKPLPCVVKDGFVWVALG